MGDGVILISDRVAREKPCLRCGYSLRHIAGARNCPECGLAVRVSLSGNDALEWSNPAWQRSVAAGAWLFALYELLTPIRWSVRSIYFQYFFESGSVLQSGWARGAKFLEWSMNIVDFAWLILLPAALFLMTRPERRQPDRLRGFRRLLLFIAGSYVLLRGLKYLFVFGGLSRTIPVWAWPYVYVPLQHPLLIVLRDLIILLFLSRIARRGGSRRFTDVTMYVVLLGGFCALLQFATFFAEQYWAETVVWHFLYPLGIALLCIRLATLLRRGAREAQLHWVTDP